MNDFNEAEYASLDEELRCFFSDEISFGENELSVGDTFDDGFEADPDSAFLCQVIPTLNTTQTDYGGLSGEPSFSAHHKRHLDPFVSCACATSLPWPELDTQGTASIDGTASSGSNPPLVSLVQICLISRLLVNQPTRYHTRSMPLTPHLLLLISITSRCALLPIASWRERAQSCQRTAKTYLSFTPLSLTLVSVASLCCYLSRTPSFSPRPPLYLLSM